MRSTRTTRSSSRRAKCDAPRNTERDHDVGGAAENISKKLLVRQDGPFTFAAIRTAQQKRPLRRACVEPQYAVRQVYRRRPANWERLRGMSRRMRACSMASKRSSTCNFSRMLCTWFFTVYSESDSRSAIS